MPRLGNGLSLHLVWAQTIYAAHLPVWRGRLLPEGLTAYIHICHFITLNKNPGVTLTGVGEAARRIIGKAISKVIKPDIMKVTGKLKLCAGQEAGIEATGHTVCILFQDESTDAAVLVDAA